MNKTLTVKSILDINKALESIADYSQVMNGATTYRLGRLKARCEEVATPVKEMREEIFRKHAKPGENGQLAIPAESVEKYNKAIEKKIGDVLKEEEEIALPNLKVSDFEVPDKENEGRQICIVSPRFFVLLGDVIQDDTE